MYLQGRTASKHDTASHAYNPSIWEAEAGGSHSEFHGLQCESLSQNKTKIQQLL